MELADIERELDRASTLGPAQAIVIPPCPELLTALRREVEQGDPDPAEIARIAQSDVAMAASLIRMANSPLFARSRLATTVGEAVTVLGVSQVVAILTGFLTRNAIPVDPNLIEHFWETSSRRAIAMGYIAKQLYDTDPGLAYTCGLFCHVGIPILLQCMKGYPGTLAEALARQDRTFTETENVAHRTDHAVVGAIVAKTWHMPPLMTAALRLHHDFAALADAQIPATARTLVAMSLIAEYLVARHEGIEEHREWDQHGPACMDHIKVTQVEVESWVDELQPMFDSVVVA